ASTTGAVCSSRPVGSHWEAEEAERATRTPLRPAPSVARRAAAEGQGGHPPSRCGGRAAEELREWRAPPGGGRAPRHPAPGWRLPGLPRPPLRPRVLRGLRRARSWTGRWSGLAASSAQLRQPRRATKFRPPGPDGTWAKLLSTGRPRIVPEWRRPLVFCHGVGVGPTMCLSFLQPLARVLGQDYPIFLVDSAAVSMRFSEDVPSAREIAANMANMLLVWGFASAHFVGHSFGTFLVSWMLRYQPGHVERCTFVDPVCFMLLKAELPALPARAAGSSVSEGAILELSAFWTFSCAPSLHCPCLS
ncbi:unnamed protein product, partial [Prorocentrum cordatum]